VIEHALLLKSVRYRRSSAQELYASLEELRRERAITDDALSAWVSGLTHERLAGPLVYMRLGAMRETPLWWAATSPRRPAAKAANSSE
jgi:hypothetical protein